MVCKTNSQHSFNSEAHHVNIYSSYFSFSNFSVVLTQLQDCRFHLSEACKRVQGESLTSNLCPCACLSEVQNLSICDRTWYC